MDQVVGVNPRENPGKFAHFTLGNWLREAERLKGELDLVRDAEEKIDERLRQGTSEVLTQQSLEAHNLRVTLEKEYIQAFDRIRGWSAVQELYPQE